MQLPEKVREVTTQGVQASTAFGISIKDTAHIKSILRDNIYSDKILAVLREYSANAWDAHRMAGKPELPIKVVIPTYQNPSLVIEDYGPGLSHEDVFNVFTQYGVSTKRGTNDAVGMLGIGSKSGFAYSDTFTIVSRHGGVRRVYVALLDESDNDALSMLSEEECQPSDTGLTIEIAVRNEDIHEFRRKAEALFQHFSPRPNINIELPALPGIRSRLKHGIIFDGAVSQWEGSKWCAVMGCVPYKVDLDQLKGPNGEPLISESFKATAGLVQFDIGEVQINASREGLKYSKITKEALVKKFELLLEEFITVVLDEIENGVGTNWEKRLRAQTLLRLGLGKKECGDWGMEQIYIGKDDKAPKTFHCSGHYIGVSEDSRLVRKTDIGRRKITGFNLTHGSYLISPAAILDAKGEPTFNADGTQKFCTWDEVNAELETFCKEKKLDGITIVDLHTLPWTPSYRAGRSGPRLTDPKHHKKFFVLNAGGQAFSTRSNSWEIEEREPSKDDVFVVLSHFETTGYNIYSERKEDIVIAKGFGITLPPIYGYKTTEKKPVDPSKKPGTHYPDWRKKFLAELPMDKIKPIVESQARAKYTKHIMKSNHWDYLSRKHVNELKKQLGIDHQIPVFLEKAFVASQRNEDTRLLEFLQRLQLVKVDASEADAEYELLSTKYPLLDAEGFSQLWYTHSEAWLHYVNLVDQQVVPVASPPPVAEPEPEPVATPAAEESTPS